MAVYAEPYTLYVTIAFSRESWVVGIESLPSESMDPHSLGAHLLGAEDVSSISSLIKHQRAE